MDVRKIIVRAWAACFVATATSARTNHGSVLETRLSRTQPVRVTVLVASDA